MTRGLEMPSFLELELAKACDFIVRESLRVRPGESLLVTIDTETDFRVAEATARAAQTLDAKVAVIWHTTPPGFGKVTDNYLPEPVKAAIPKADVWVEYNNQWLLYSTPWEEAINSKRVRHLCLGGMDVERIVRCIGKVDWKKTSVFLDKLAEMTQNAKKVRITNRAGNDIQFEMGGRPVVSETMENYKPNLCGFHSHFLGGQIIWAPLEQSINGRITFDGSLAGGGDAIFGVLHNPVTLEIKNGRILNIEGG